jgi:hypothetical protein
MERYVYSFAISILGVQGTQIATANEMPRDEAKRFIAAVKDALKRLHKLRTGRMLINAINASGHTCRIFCAPPGNEGGALADPSTLVNNARRLVKSFRPQHLNMMPHSKKIFLADGGKNVLGEIKTELQKSGMHQGRAIASTELDFILVRAWGDIDKGRNALVTQLGKSRNVIDNMCEGLVKIEDDDYFRICFAYYEHLQPGPGCSTQVKLKPEVKLTAASGTYKPKTDVSAVAPEIILGHELIHAWRMMVGRRVVDHGWEEEAMTTGCGPFTHLPITENALRREGAYPNRPWYPTTVMNTSFGADLNF